MTQRLSEIVPTVRRLAAAALLLLPAAEAAAQSSLLPFRDPFAPPGVRADCDLIPAREREKIACGDEAATARPAALSSAQSGPAARSGPERTDASRLLLPFSDPFAAGGEPPDCADLPRRERAKLGFPDDCDARASVTDETPVPGNAGGRTPMVREDLPDLYRRVLSLPGARLAEEPGAAAADGPELAPFTVFYVYEEREAGEETWLLVGANAFGETRGWLRADRAEDWRTMLVMQYASKGGRNPVLFFKERDDLIDLATDRYVTEEIRYLYEEIEEDTYEDDYLIAREPALGVDEENVYLMPILDHRLEFTAMGEPLRLLEVASLNTDAAATIQTDVREADNRSVPRRSGALRRFRIGVAFVIDTTRSMGPYIDHTRAIIASTVQSLEAEGMLDSFAFGLVGFRDNASVDPGIGYVSRVFQPLVAGAGPREVIRGFDAMEPARAATQGFSEDAFAGLHTAINELDWEGTDARIIVLVTDAAPRDPFDPLVSHPGWGALNVVQDADAKRIGVSVLHLITPQALRAGNVDVAVPVYREIARSGDRAFEKYLPVDTTDPNAFVAQVELFQRGLIEAVETLNRSRPVQQAEKTAGEAGDLGQVLANEVFRAQLEYLGRERDQAAPRFYRAWAADRDLSNPTVEALEVKVFLTRNQLAALDKGVGSILDAYLAKSTGGGDFFDAMQALAADTSVEGGGRTLETAGALLPSFLSALPYRSDILQLDEAQWTAFGPAGQRQVIDRLQSKLVAYQSLASEKQGWIDLGAGDVGLEVYPIPLDLLP